MIKQKELVPKRRFEGFNKEWKRQELGDFSDVTKLAGFEYTKHVVYSNTGTIIALRGLNVKNGRLILDEVKYIDQSDFSKLNRSKLFKGDILFTYVGTVGELAIIPKNHKYYLAPNVSRFRLDKEIDSQFIIQMIGDMSYYNKVIFPLIATSSQPALSMENIRKFTLNVPESKEQQKIGQFFKHLDDMIALQQRKIDKTKALKSAYLAEMFPVEGERTPKRRFSGFTDEWRLCSLGDLTKINTGDSDLQDSISDGKYPFFVRSENIQRSNRYTFNGEAILIPGEG